MTDLLTIRDLLAAYNPSFAKADYQPVFAWLERGADMELDILPVLRHWTAQKADIYSLRFFTPYIIRTTEARLGATVPPERMTDHQRAARIAFLTRRVGRCMPRETAWLDRFEAEHGRVDREPDAVPVQQGESFEGSAPSVIARDTTA